MSITISERIKSQQEIYSKIIDSIKSNIRVAIPGIIQSFDSQEQTVVVQPSIREKIIDIDLNESWVQLPLLLDVPIILPRAGGYCITFPINSGDECLVVFADMCIDAWFSNGNIQNQIEKRRHDLSDAFAILGTWSQPRTVANYATDALQIRNEDKTSYIEMKNNNINLVGNILINGVPI